MRFGAGSEAGAAIVAARPPPRRDPHQGKPTQKPVKRPHRAQVTAPTAARDEQVQQEYQQHDAPAEAGAARVLLRARACRIIIAMGLAANRIGRCLARPAGPQISPCRRNAGPDGVAIRF